MSKISFAATAGNAAALSAIAYAVISIAITLFNKAVLSTHGWYLSLRSCCRVAVKPFSAE
jgi:hypothetical protein